MLPTKIRPDDTILEKALETVRTSEEDARQFAIDPKAYLKSKGVSTEGLKFTTAHQGELSDAQLDSVAGGGFCAEVGVGFVCGGVGW